MLPRLLNSQFDAWRFDNGRDTIEGTICEFNIGIHPTCFTTDKLLAKLYNCDLFYVTTIMHFGSKISTNPIDIYE